MGGDIACCQALADALWDGVRHEPPLPTASGLRGWYLSNVYGRVIHARRRRLWSHRSPEPWLTTQVALTRIAGYPSSRVELRWEGLPGAHSYEQPYRDVAIGRFRAPYIFVAGYSRTGTTSLQNLVMEAFPDHLQNGSWTDAGHPMRLWWYPKHRADVAERIALLGPDVARVLLTVRPLVPSLASLALYQGYWNPDDVSSTWILEEADAWTQMIQVGRHESVVAVPFSSIRDLEPAALADRLGASLGVLPVPGDYRESSWRRLSARGISPDVLEDPERSNLPNVRRARALADVSAHIEGVLGDRVSAADELLQGITPPRDPRDAVLEH